ncbi:MAG: hypothetical protein FWE74_09370 [Oscillospiraceae bacterium]|nr:hypothetical protein [Oscillospiraceae bacterium]
MFVNDTDRGVPLGLGMALAQNSGALSRFAGLPLAERQAIIERTHSIGSKKEMKSFVDNLAKNWEIS